MSIFKFPKRISRAAAPKSAFRPSDMAVKNPDEQVGLIQGQQPASIQEWWIAKSLERLGLRYFYQFRVFGGRSVRGGQVVDFVVMLAPSSVALQYFGGYWHRDELINQDKLSIYQLQEEFGRVVILTDGDCDTFEETYASVRRELGV